MKICSKCSLTKPETDYYVKDGKSGKLHAHCKECYKEHRKTFYAFHYEKYGDLYRQRARERKHRLRQEFRTNILEYLSTRSCEICGESDIRVLDFDHIDPTIKLFSISQSTRLGHNWTAVLSEIKKCRVLCANCHRKHTATQANWYKTA